jgi:hypothetical protein
VSSTGPSRQVPVSPRAARLASPSWLDGRLVLGVLLVLVSVLVGAKVLAGAEASQRVWVASRDLAPGTVLTSTDLREGQVRLYATSRRYLAGAKPVGYVVHRGVSADELVPADALSAPGREVPRREVTVPVEVGHLPPDLSRHDQVDVYVTPDSRSAKETLPPRLVLSAQSVARVTRGGGLASRGQDQPVVLSVAPADVLVLVQAMGEGRVDLVRVPRRQQRPLTLATPGP